MLNLNPTTLNLVVEQACIDAAAHGRWLVAIGRAVVELETNPWISRNEHGGLIIGSPSGACYSSNGVCQCKAFEFGQACWHRAASRIVRRHDEMQALRVEVVAGVEAGMARAMLPLSERLTIARREMDEVFG